MLNRSVSRGRIGRLTPIAALLASSTFAALMSGHAWAQETGPAPVEAKEGDVLNLSRVVVTGTSQKKSKMRSSVSVTDIDLEQVQNFGARTEAEVLLLIPGIRTDNVAGPGGNANISVRGLPITSGGSKYVQMQEDGLPVVQFGDMNFSNNDYWIRFDSNVDNIQTLRGGSASVFASHAPGAVLNYISKTGETTGGSASLMRGLNFDETRAEAEYGGRLSPTLRYHVGGYLRDGEGPRKNSTASLRGYQFKGNITQEFNGGKGYLRASVKLLDEHAPTYTSYPVAVDISGNTLTGFHALAGFDARRDAQYSPYNTSMPVVGPAGTAVSSGNLTDGITVKARSLGLEFHNEYANGVTVDNKFRYASHDGAFQSQFFDIDTLSGMLSGFGADARAVYANGPKAGQAVTQGNLATGLVSRSAAIDTRTPDMGNLVNDLSVARKFKLDGSAMEARAGWFHSRQKVVQQWAINERVMEVGRDGALIDVADAAGTPQTTMGLTGFNNQWGACCARDINAAYTTDAPYVALSLETGNWDLDAGFRHDRFRAGGSYAGPVRLAGGLDVNRDGAITAAERTVYIADVANRHPVDYRINYNSYSAGANYRFDRDLSAFVRASKGGRAIADRLLFSANIDPVTGGLAPGGAAAALAVVKQVELGVKQRGTRDWGSYGLFATVYHATTSEYDYDQTRTIGPKLNVMGFRSNGVELESALGIGDFSLNANAVLTDLIVTSDLVGSASGNSTVGKTPSGVARWRYTLTPSYRFNRITVGATVRGQTGVWADNNESYRIDGHHIVNAFANFDLGKGLTLALNVNNLFNKLWLAGGANQGTLAEARRLGTAAGVAGIVSGGFEMGRTATVTLRYAF